MPMIQIRMDTSLKKEAEEIFTEIGLDMSTAVRMFFKAVIRERRIPFELSAGEAEMPIDTSAPDMSGMQFILSDKKKAENLLYGFRNESYEAEMNKDTEGWRIRIKEKIKEQKQCGN